MIDRLFDFDFHNPSKQLWKSVGSQDIIKVKQLFEKHAKEININYIHPYYGCSILHKAAETNNLAILKLLFFYCGDTINVNITGGCAYNRLSPLDAARGLHNKAAITFLETKGAISLKTDEELQRLLRY